MFWKTLGNRHRPFPSYNAVDPGIKQNHSLGGLANSFTMIIPKSSTSSHFLRMTGSDFCCPSRCISEASSLLQWLLPLSFLENSISTRWPCILLAPYSFLQATSPSFLPFPNSAPWMLIALDYLPLATLSVIFPVTLSHFLWLCTYHGYHSCYHYKYVKNHDRCSISLLLSPLLFLWFSSTIRMLPSPF